MLTKEVREWVQKVECNQYSYDDAIYQLSRFALHLTHDELKQIKNKLINCYKK